MAQKSSEYWEKRIAASTWKTYNSLEERNRDLLDFYIDASEQVKKELYSIAEKYSKDGVLSLSEMHKQNRLTALNKKLESIIEDLGHKTEESAKKNMQDGFRTVYKDTAVAMGDEDFSMPNKKLMEKLLQEPWRGDSFSGRLWKNQKKLAVGLNDLLLTGLQQGKTATEIAVSLHNFMGQGFNECHRLVRTETMHYLNDATMQRYKDAGIKSVQIWAAEDERTCDECSKYHGKIYPIDKCPHVPLHPNCRCTIIPVTDESMIDDYEKRHGNGEAQKVAGHLEYENPSSKPANKFGQKIIFDDNISNEKWSETRRILTDLAQEYNTRLTAVSRVTDSRRNAGSVGLTGDLEIGSRKPEVAFHEFAHSITQNNLVKYDLGDDTDTDFWKEIKKIRTKYRKAVSRGEAKSITGYANENVDEFFAEAFAHAKMRELGYENPLGFGTDFTYSQQVLDTVNKYFKKSIAKDSSSGIMQAGINHR